MYASWKNGNYVSDYLVVIVQIGRILFPYALVMFFIFGLIFVSRPIVGFSIEDAEVEGRDIHVMIALDPQEFRTFGPFNPFVQSSFRPNGKMHIYFGPSEDVGIGRVELRAIKFVGQRGVGATWESDLETILEDSRSEICRLRANRIVITYDDRNRGERREVETSFHFERTWVISFWLERLLELPPLFSIRTRARWTDVCES